MNQGSSECNHSHIFYVQEPFDGQAFWCDNEDCKRHERIPYSKETAGQVMNFPVGALIRTPNPKYGGEDVYAFCADENGEAELLPRELRYEKFI